MNENMEINGLRNKIILNNITIFILSIIFITFVIIDKTTIMNLNFAFPAYILMLFSIIVLMAYISKINMQKSNVTSVLVYIFIYMVFLTLYSISTNINDINYAIRIMVYFSIVFLFSNLKYTRNQFKYLILPFSILTVLMFLSWFNSYEMFKFASIFQNPNTLGIVVFNSLFFHLLYLYITKNKLMKLVLIVLILMNLSLLYLSTSRAVWLSLTISIMVLFLYRQLTKTRFIYRITFLITLFVIFIFSYFYPKLYTMELGWKINDIILDFTGKSFFTGREDLWAEIILMIETKPLFGFGLSASSKELIGTNHEAHNMYLNVVLQTGLVGLLFYSIVLFVIWDRLFLQHKKIKEHNKYYKLFPAYMAGLIIYQGFELSFVRGSYSISLLEWLFLAIGLGLTNFVKCNNENKLKVGEKVAKGKCHSTYL